MNLSEFTYFELELLHKLVDSRLENAYEFRDKYRSSSLSDKKDYEINELTVLKIKIINRLENMKEPSVMERIEHKNKRYTNKKY